ncbi:MAG: hypothetical protein IJ761_03585 [Bacteroidales bacterium]|nr:hypothetical protein [Bacteroidales bacterium]
MNKLRLALTALTFLVAFAEAQAQLSIPATRLQFNLNADSWRYVRTLDIDDHSTIYLYCYTGEILTDADGDTTLPVLRIYVDSQDYDDLLDFVYQRYEVQPYQTLEEAPLRSIKQENINHIGIYTSPTSKKDFQFMATYIKDRKTYIEFRLETSADTFEEMETIFQNITNSIK